MENKSANDSNGSAFKPNSAGLFANTAGLFANNAAQNPPNVSGQNPQSIPNTGFSGVNPSYTGLGTSTSSNPALVTTISGATVQPSFSGFGGYTRPFGTSTPSNPALVTSTQLTTSSVSGPLSVPQQYYGPNLGPRITTAASPAAPSTNINNRPYANIGFNAQAVPAPIPNSSLINRLCSIEKNITDLSDNLSDVVRRLNVVETNPSYQRCSACGNVSLILVDPRHSYRLSEDNNN